MQEIMKKNSYYKINLLFYRFNKKEKEKNKKDGKSFETRMFDLLYEAFDAIKSSIFFFLLMSILCSLSVFLFHFSKDMIALIITFSPFLYLAFMNICIQKRQRKEIVQELGEEYHDLFFSQRTYSQDPLIKKTILFKKFIDTEKQSLTSEEIDLSIQYIEETNKYIGFKLPNILSKIQNLGLFGIWLAALLQKDIITIQNLWVFLEFLVYFYSSIFVCFILYDIFFKKSMRDFCFILKTYKELYCKN